MITTLPMKNNSFGSTITTTTWKPHSLLYPSRKTSTNNPIHPVTAPPMQTYGFLQCNNIRHGNITTMSNSPGTKHASATWQHHACLLILLKNGNNSPNRSLTVVTNTNTWTPWNSALFVHVNHANSQKLGLLLFLSVNNDHSPTMLMIMTLTPTKWMPQAPLIFWFTNADNNPKMAQQKTMATQPMKQQPH